ncbi:MAG: phytoene desaturase [Spirochaeta sp.]|nr:phytoene desaturase [Spirochaeta sp.]
MGPSWYLMPEVFGHYFSLFGKKREDYYDLSPLDPYYKVYFEGGQTAKLTPRFNENQKLFESFEKGGGKALKAYMEQSTYKYNVAMEDFLYRDYKHIGQFFNRRLMTEGLRLGVLGKLDSFVSNYVKDHRAKQILEYAMVFLGTDPAQALAIYSIMTHVDLNLGVFFPQKGMAGAAEGFASLCRDQGVELITGAEVLKVLTEGNRAVGVETNKGTFMADVVVSSADYHHSDTNLLEDKHRTYSDSYWEKRMVAPSMFIAYLGIGRELKGLEHHNLYFAKDWDAHFDAIFKNPDWPRDPCFYLSCISKTDSSSAPAGCENVFLLVPVAPGLVDTEEQRNAYFEHVADHVHVNYP